MVPQRTQPSIRSRRGAFTLLELIVVITIIGILSTIVVMSTKGIPARARRTRIDADLKTIISTATGIFTETGRWPESIEEMVNYKTPDGKSTMTSLESFPKDPWGNEYRYEIVENAPRVTCLGVDNAEGGDPGTEAEDVVRPDAESR